MIRLSIGFFLAAAVGVACAAKSDDGGNTSGGGKGGDAVGGGQGGDPGGGGGNGQAGEPGGGGNGAGGDVGNPGGQGGQPATAGAGGTGGTINTGGTVGTGGTGGTPATDPSASTCVGKHPYCSDFEAFKTGEKLPYPFNVVVPHPTNKLLVAEDKAHSGKKSIYIEVPVGGGSADFTLGVKSFFKNPKKIGYSRMWVWLDGLPGVSTNNHWSIMGLAGAGSNVAGLVGFGGWGEAQRRMLYYGTTIPDGGLADCSSRMPTFPVPLKKWSCVEMIMDETLGSTPFRVMVDGTQVMAIASKPSGCFAMMETLSVSYGFRHYHDQIKPVKMWIDDIAVDEKAIGCN